MEFSKVFFGWGGVLRCRSVGVSGAKGGRLIGGVQGAAIAVGGVKVPQDERRALKGEERVEWASCRESCREVDGAHRVRRCPVARSDS